MKFQRKFSSAKDALIEEGVVVGRETKVWNGAQIRSGAVIGNNCVIGRDVFIDHGVIVGKIVSFKIRRNSFLLPC